MPTTDMEEAVPVLMDCFSGRMVALFPAASALQFSVAPPKVWLDCSRIGKIRTGSDSGIIVYEMN